MLRINSEVKMLSADCPSVLDVVLLLDLSGSVEAEYELIMDFSRALSLGLDINSDAVRVGVVAFSDNVSHVINLDQFIGQQRNFTEALNFPHHRGKTNIQVSRLTFKLLASRHCMISAFPTNYEDRISLFFSIVHFLVKLHDLFSIL